MEQLGGLAIKLARQARFLDTLFARLWPIWNKESLKIMLKWNHFYTFPHSKNSASIIFRYLHFQGETKSALSVCRFRAVAWLSLPPPLL